MSAKYHHSVTPKEIQETSRYSGSQENKSK